MIVDIRVLPLQTNDCANISKVQELKTHIHIKTANNRHLKTKKETT